MVIESFCLSRHLDILGAEVPSRSLSGISHHLSVIICKAS